jgi:YVTN family beta-propeller protein
MKLSNARGVLAVAVLALAGCAAPGPVSTAASTAGQASATLAPTSPSPEAIRAGESWPEAVVDVLDAGGAGWSMVKAGGDLWIQVDSPVDAIVRVDIETGRRSSAVPLGWKVSTGPEGLWAVCCDWLVRVDPVTGEELLRVPMGGQIALADGATWLLNDEGLHGIDATSGEIGDPLVLDGESACAEPKDLAIAFDSAWLACREGAVVRVQLADGTTRTIPTAAGAHTFAVTDSGVWVTNYRANSVSRIDPATNAVTTIEDVGHGVGITTGDGYVWASTRTGIAKIDPVAAAIVGTIPLGSGEYYELVWDDGMIWVSTRGNRILKVDTSIAAM